MYNKTTFVILALRLEKASNKIYIIMKDNLKI